MLKMALDAIWQVAENIWKMKHPIPPPLHMEPAFYISLTNFDA